MDTQNTDNDADALAAQLAVAEPTAGLWDELEFAKLSATGRIDALVACERLVRHAEALRAQALAALEEARSEEDPVECTETEVCTAVNWSPRAADARLTCAGALARVFPETLALLSQGAVSWEQARSMPELTAGLDDQTARAVQERVLPKMPRQTLAATRNALHRAVERVDPDAAADRHAYEKTQQRVEVRPQPAGMAFLSLYTQAETAKSMMAAVDVYACKREKGDNRTLDQRRADIFTNMILAGVASSKSQSPVISAQVQVVVTIETLLGISGEPGELDGYGPICAEQAKEIAFAPGSRWRWLLCTGDGVLLNASSRKYRPSAALARFVRLRDRVCRFPGCTMPAVRCDLDHKVPFGEGGETCDCNLHPLCRRHHNLKGHGIWAVSSDGEVETWTAPTEHTYISEPERYPVSIERAVTPGDVLVPL